MTNHQQSLLEYITDYLRANKGRSPSYDEMREEMGWASKSVINRTLVNMESQGLIRRVAGKARSIYPTEAGLALLQGDLLKFNRELEAQNG